MNDEMPTLYEAPHADLVGATGSGKTTLALALYRQCPGVGIYVDPAASGEARGVTVDYRDGETFDPALIAEHNRIVVIPPDGTGTEADMDVIQHIQNVLFDLGAAIPHEDGRFYLFVDEAHEFAPLHAPGDNPLIRVAKRGRKRNIRFYPVSQSPADLSKKMVKQMNYHVVFALNDYSLDYLKRYGMPQERIGEAVGHKDEHKFVVWDGFDLYGPYRLDSQYVQ